MGDSALQYASCLGSLAVGDSHPTCPQPHRGDNPPGLRYASATVSASNPQHNIIYRDCVTGRWGPTPTACFRFAHNLDYVKRLP